MEIREVATLIFYDEQRRVLLQNRGNISKSGEEWGFFGGGIEKEETPEEALVREIREELSHDLNGHILLGVYQGVAGNGTHLINHVYVAREPIFPNFRQREGSGMRSFSIEDTEKLRMNELDHVVLASVKEYMHENF